MAKTQYDTHMCPLYGREVFYGECYEVQEVREDEMDMKWLMEPIDIDRANEICEKCKWYIVNAHAHGDGSSVLSPL